jgi:TonB family protein
MRRTPNGIGHNKECTGITCLVVEVVVTVNSDGTVKSALMQRSWGAGADAAALAAARKSKYIPKTVNCQPVTGTYIFREMFVKET